MLTLILIILIVLIAYWFYYRRSLSSNSSSFGSSQVNLEWNTFLKTSLNSNSLQELKTKLNGKTLNELLEENSDYETEVDTLTRTKNSLEQDLLAQSNAFQNRLREKDREVKKLKENLTSEKQQHKGSLTRITKLTEQITQLEQKKEKLTAKINSLSISSITKQDLEHLKSLVKGKE